MSYYPNREPLGRLCQAGCGTKLPRVLNEAGIETHPTCHPTEQTLLVKSREAVKASSKLDVERLSGEQI